MTTRKNIRQQNAERRLSHLRWDTATIQPKIALWEICIMAAVAVFIGFGLGVIL